MKPHLRPCPACGRHVRTTEAACPFCQRALPDSVRAATAPLLPNQRLSRAALVAFGMLGLGTPACDEDTTVPAADAASRDTGAPSNPDAAAPSDGQGPTVDAGSPGPDATPSPDAAFASDAPVYGAPPVDGGNFPQPVYGAPFPGPDAGDGPR